MPALKAFFTMTDKKNIFVINGSASQNSSNEKLIDNFANLTQECFNVQVFHDLKTLPHFDPELSISNTPTAVLELRNNINNADGILICTPEYIFSIPGALKTAIEWCVSTTVFSDKPTGLITASANGQKAHEELQLIMKTIMAQFTEGTTLLIPGIKGKITQEGRITDGKTLELLKIFIEEYKSILKIAPVRSF
jgi:NAD(P)H-dependent FMN reductase